MTSDNLWEYQMTSIDHILDLGWPNYSAVVGKYKHREEQYSKIINVVKESEGYV